MIPFGDYIHDYFNWATLESKSVIHIDRKNQLAVFDFNKFADYKNYHPFTTIYGVSDSDTNKSYPELDDLIKQKEVRQYLKE